MMHCKDCQKQEEATILIDHEKYRIWQYSECKRLRVEVKSVDWSLTELANVLYDHFQLELKHEDSKKAFGMLKLIGKAKEYHPPVRPADVWKDWDIPEIKSSKFL